MKKNKKQILRSVLNVIYGISDIDYQKRVWVRGEGPEAEDYDESCCNFFQDGEGVLSHYKDFDLSEKQRQDLKKFRDEFKYFDDNIEINYSVPAEFIDTPEWAKIMESAKKVLKAFNYEQK